MEDAEEQEEMVEMPVHDEDDSEMVTDGRRSVHFQDFEDLDMEEEENQCVQAAVRLLRFG